MNIEEYCHTFSDVKLSMKRIENGCAIYTRHMAMYLIEAKVKITESSQLFLTIGATSHLLDEITVENYKGVFTFGSVNTRCFQS